MRCLFNGFMIDEKLQQELRVRFNPDGSILRRQQLVMLDLLKHFDAICKEHDIKYWLSSGTCLGAVRHGGFIPWDDDLDVEMLREDYLKFEKVFHETEDYALQTYKNDPYYVVPYAKLRNKKTKIVEHGQDVKYKYRGIYIDIFVLERCPHTITRIYNRLAWDLLIFGSKSSSVFTRSVFFVGKFLLHKSIPFVRFMFGHLLGNQLRHTYGSGFSKNYRQLEWIFPLKKALFEESEFPIPINHAAYLDKMYKNHMQLPDLDAIKPHVTEVFFE